MHNIILYDTMQIDNFFITSKYMYMYLFNDEVSFNTVVLKVVIPVSTVTWLHIIGTIERVESTL